MSNTPKSNMDSTPQKHGDDLWTGNFLTTHAAQFDSDGNVITNTNPITETDIPNTTSSEEAS
jgi:hypothetical protein